MLRGYKMIVDEIRQNVPPGTVIPTPEGARHWVDGWRHSRRSNRQEDAMFYCIPSKIGRPHKKSVTASEWEQAYRQLQSGGEFTHRWFGQSMKECARQGSCNFTAIGGIFELLGLARHAGPGIYRYTGRQI